MVQARTLTRAVIFLLIFGGFYYLFSTIGFLLGIINYGGPANQSFALGCAVVVVVILIWRKVIKWKM